MSTCRILLAAACLTLGASALHAQKPRPFQFELGGGASFLTGDDRNWWSDGYNVQAGVVIPTPLPQAAVLVTGFYHGFSGKNRSTQTYPGAPDTLFLGDFSVLAGTVGVRYRLTSPTSASRVLPYFTLGAGAYRIESKAVLYGNHVSGADTKFGGTLGLGLDFPLGATAAFLEARVHNVFTDAGSSKLYPLTFGFRF